MILTELFDNVARYQLTADGTGYFNINGKAYVVDFYNSDEEKDTVEISFALRQGLHPQGTPKYVHDVSGTGDELQVFATVIAVCQDYLKRRPLRKVVFTSKTNETSRLKLYDRLAARLAPGWDIKTHLEGGEKVYELTNPKFNVPATQGQGSFEDIPV